MERTPDKSQYRKLTAEEEKPPTVLAGIQTCNLSITSLAYPDPSLELI